MDCQPSDFKERDNAAPVVSRDGGLYDSPSCLYGGNYDPLYEEYHVDQSTLSG